jgi:hypothetical protein
VGNTWLAELRQDASDVSIVAMRLSGGADPPTDGYWVWLECSCGAEFECWVTAAGAEHDLLWSDLTALPN